MTTTWAPSERTGGSTEGLRARKRARTQREIVENAIRLFRRNGVRSASLREVARSSQVSQATLFNYFPNKGALAEAWVRGEIASAVTSVAEDLAVHGLRPALRNLCRCLTEIVDDERTVRLEAWRETGRAPREPLARNHPIVRAIAREQERERVRADLSPRTLAEMLIDAIEGGLIEGLHANDEAGGGVARSVQARVDLILDGARKRNERVVAPSSGGRKLR